MDNRYPPPRIPTGLILFIIAFAVAPLISEKYALEIGVLLTYALFRLRAYLKGKIKKDKA